MQETQVQSLGWEDTLGKGMATHSCILAWRIHGQRSLEGYRPWGHKRAGHEWAETLSQGPVYLSLQTVLNSTIVLNNIQVYIPENISLLRGLKHFPFLFKRRIYYHLKFVTLFIFPFVDIQVFKSILHSMFMGLLFLNLRGSLSPYCYSKKKKKTQKTDIWDISDYLKEVSILIHELMRK